MTEANAQPLAPAKALTPENEPVSGKPAKRTKARKGTARHSGRAIEPVEVTLHPDRLPARATRDDPLDRAAHAALAMATGGLSPASMALAWLDWSMHLAASPGKCLELTLRAWRDAWLPGAGSALAASSAPQVLLGATHGAARGTRSGATQNEQPAAATADPRFAAPAWSLWPFCVYRDTFLGMQRWWEDATTGVPGVERHHEELARFGARQWIDAWSPGNFVATNPAVLEATAKTGGTNFVAGAQHWLADFEDMASRHVVGRPRSPSAYQPGRDVAVTPGKVVWRNALCELLQYAPSTAHVAREPVFIVPSWIMKYYILDLQPHDSLVRFLVDQGYTVFMMSWRNPGAEARDLGLNDYLSDGLLAALGQVRERCAEPVHAVGYCLGGTLLAVAAATLARDGHTDALRSVTLLAAQTDFTEPGELGLFIDASELAALDALMWRQGYLDGAQMAAAFQLLNARDLIWSRMMSEYLLGRRSKPNDLMAWNADTTRLPYRMHTEYLHSLFLDNDLAAGRYHVDGRNVALSDIEWPMFMVGTERDHVSPWRSVYKLLLFTHNPVTFLLTAGGHNAGIVSEPGHAGRHYRCATRERGAPYRGRQEFLDETPVTEGSWWPRWTAWLRTQSSGEVKARAVPDGLCDAPGTYIFEP
ncbi:PHA/PHB synthase family protein [Paraburkholderia kururiensis]|uniref:Alpha/beta fold hydrolase n=1 Tax=Paraburkholderia kururiensis TaxID=984307 RepID=A0ABZ0WQQ5_9BURK|nr:alpha/beta fold hydrolase [Paraburkholderia kururiensis]WQD79734.1 alpha/beta fold hydrolase [Paraburkholderia kururiensis]